MTPKEKTAQPRQDYMEHLLILSRTLNSSLELKEVLNLTMESVVEFVGAERGFIMLFDEKGNLKVRAARRVDPVKVENYESISKTIIKAASEQGKHLLTVDAQKDDRFKAQESVQLTGMRSVLCVPLSTKEKIIGLIYLDNNFQSGAFNKKHLEMLEAFANQAAVAILNARLHENEMKLMKEIHEKEKMRLASERANQLKSDFVNIVAHELKNPLTVIQNYASLLTMGKKIPEEDKLDWMESILREAKRMTNMINQQLDVASLEAGKHLSLDVSETDLSPLLDEVVEMEITKKHFKKGKHSIKKDYVASLPALKCDGDKLKQILLNLVNNALKYSPNGGEVRIRVTYNDDNFFFEISDQGRGISEEDQQKLFQKFERFQKDGSIKGTGLGLYLVKNLIELHGGKISVKSKSGEGARFRFNIPRNLKPLLPER